MGRSTTRNAKGLVTGMALAATLGMNTARAVDAVGTDTPLNKPLALNICIYDPMGVQGDLYGYAKDLALSAKKWHVNATLRGYTDERLATEDFKAGQCDGIALSTLRAKQFNSFIGSIDSIGAAPTPQHVRALVAGLDKPSIAPLTINGDWQVVTVMPLGATYVMVNDRRIDSVEHALARKVGVLNFDKAQGKLVARLGAQPVSVDLLSFGSKFNNGEVDIIAAPVVAIKPMELYRGLDNGGGIYRLPLTQMTGTLLINRTRLAREVPDLDARISQIRRYALQEMDKTIRYISQQEQAVPARYWLDLSPPELARYNNLMRDARIQLTHEGYYDPRMMSLLKKVRCRAEPTRGECMLTDE